MADRVRVWVSSDRAAQHFADPPGGDTTTRHWDGETICGQSGELHWIHWEVVDEGATCPDCMRLEGTFRPALEGDYPGPP